MGWLVCARVVLTQVKPMCLRVPRQTWILKILLNDGCKTVQRRSRAGLLQGRLREGSHFLAEVPHTQVGSLDAVADRHE
jgi:hypothetical protein